MIQDKKGRILLPCFLFRRMPEIEHPILISAEDTEMKRMNGSFGGGLRIRAIAAVFFTAAVFIGCGGGDDAAGAREARDAAEAKARRATERMVGTLMGEVQKSIKENGLAGTVTHCASRAQELSTIVGVEEGVTIRRVTEKTRNPINAPDTYERRILSQFAEMARNKQIVPATAHVEIVNHEGRNVLRYIKPIMIGKTCLGCHGSPESIPEDVRAELRTFYPTDLATGYAENDLRGAVSVIVPMDVD
jgi:hypothetical protein